MNASPSQPPMTSICGGGPDDGQVAIRFGFAAEPVVDLHHLDGTALYSECLMRVMVAESVMLRGGDLIGALEGGGETGLLDAAIVDLVLDGLAEDPHARLGCNVSPCTLADPSQWAWFMQCIGERRWLASRLTLEITESCPLGEIAGAAERLREAKRLGCRLAIDDFGTGFATPAFLYGVDIDWDIVKIDRSCFGDLGKTPSDHDGLLYLIQLAKSFAPVVVVEGIETQEHLTLARKAGARFGQGWMFDGPVCDRWSVPDKDVSLALAAAMTARGAIVQKSEAPAPTNLVQGNIPEKGARNYLLSRVNRIGERVRALAARARTGGAA